MASYTTDTVIEAPRDVVYGIFADRERNGEFLPVTTRLKTPGTTERQGVGAVHFLGFGNVGVSEQITTLVPGERIEYKVVAGAPVKSHTGVITFADAPGGTRVVYTMESIPKLPVPAPLLELGLRALVGSFVSGARKTAIKRASA
ncbi:SRPBCC family protein [Antrihabitans cavernicola]|uniref:SRPBCC family protein n=1 Tax=Antrihabitans cavernicola TaxID=2495913 RepID=A0A5A7S3Q1_9NOCA|nr:SRPBCC family protein [Spelaeibacter cavernicola]KAA0016185.1 SRPBCC family protein [Spelaeibacter cavernicola]